MTLETSAPETPRLTLGDQLAGKYMTFKLAGEEYGLPILSVRDVIGLLDITRVPRTAPAVRGVINLRGRVIPVMDLRLKFGMGETALADQTVIVVLEIAAGEMVTMGILVDEVLEVLDISSGDIQPTPEFGRCGIHTETLLGIGQRDERVIFLLDTTHIIDAGEAKAVSPEPRGDDG